MDSSVTLQIKLGIELTSDEISKIQASKEREWKILRASIYKELHETFFLIKNTKGDILAQGQLMPINGVIFNNKTFDISGIGGILANNKGKGYGRMLILAMKNYLIEKKKTGVGFTGDAKDFYLKGGYSVDKDSLHRFVHVVNGRKITNTTEKYVVYHTGEDRFMEKVLAYPDKNIILPIDPDW